jgi:hypothetical protein
VNTVLFGNSEIYLRDFQASEPFPGRSYTTMPNLVEIGATVWKCIKRKQAYTLFFIDKLVSWLEEHVTCVWSIINFISILLEAVNYLYQCVYFSFIITTFNSVIAEPGVSTLLIPKPATERDLEAVPFTSHPNNTFP